VPARASASVIAAPAAVRLALPEASPSLDLTAALGITFPFNLAIGIPLYHALARLVQGVSSDEDRGPQEGDDRGRGAARGAPAARARGTRLDEYA
jgi:hypothetical protein